MMTSQSLLDRFSSSRNRSPILPLRKPPPRPPSEYDLDELEPRPDDMLNGDNFPRPRLRNPNQIAAALPSPSFEDSRASSSSSPSRARTRAMFAGPPPPIASSRLLNSYDYSRAQPSQHSDGVPSPGLLATSRFNLDGSFFDQRQQRTASSHDSIWRGLQRRERALQREIQKLLDQQASGLVAGSGGTTSETDFDGRSEVDGSSASSTFYSAATSKSRMINSLHMPTRSTADGNVIPVRQPTPRKPLGLHSARAGLRKSMAALLELKADEDAHVEAALAQRKDALSYLNRMSSRRDKIYAELHTLEDDSEEPLGKELRELSSEHDNLSQEIKLLEEKLVGMRNRRRHLRDRIDNVNNRREAGLSGYRAAGRDIDSEVQNFIHRPPIVPLDLDAIGDIGQNSAAKPSLESPGGLEFLRLRPERRTVSMARAWWEGEISILEDRKAKILSDRQALDEGAAVWSEVTQLVADFESGLRKMVKSSLTSVRQGAADTQQATLRKQLASMDSVVAELEKRLQLAEEKHWNLLICAIGAELEAFVQAKDMLSSALDPVDDEDQEGSSTTGAPEDGEVSEPPQTSQEHPDESDNEVPPDLLVSHVEPHEPVEAESPQNSAILWRQDSNEVPPEFLAEHRNKLD